MPVLNVATPFNIVLEFSIASFIKRAIAWIIDLAVIFSFGYVMIFFILETLGDVNFDAYRIKSLPTVLLLFMVVLPCMLYPLLMEIFNNGSSIGKKVMGLKVLNKEGAAPSLSQYFLRWMLFIPNYFLVTLVLWGAIYPSVLLYIGMFMFFAAIPDIITVLVSKNYQRLGDLAAGTIVIDIKHKMAITETVFEEIEEEQYTPLYPEVMRLSDRDVNGLKNLLHSKNNTKDDGAYMLKVVDRIEEVLQIERKVSPQDFIKILLKDYNYITQQHST